MANNVRRYGFRWASSANGSSQPVTVRKHVASGVTFSDGSNTVPLSAGDPVKLKSDGGVELAASGNAVYGIVLGVGPYWDGTKMVRGSTLPSGTTWGTNYERQSWVYVAPASQGLWEIDAEDSSYTSEATYRNAVNLQFDHAFDTAITTSAWPQLKTSTAGATTDKTWRLEDISPTVENQDFSGLYVKLLVRVVLSQEPGAAAATYIVAGV
jgi:hypothetical protein